MTAVAVELRTYFGRFRLFDRTDWLVYLAWVGLMSGLFISTGGFLLIGHRAGVVFPVEAWFVPVGAAIFALAISIDTIGHRTVYKADLAGGEALIHHIIMFTGIGSCVLLCAAYPSRTVFALPAAILTALSFIYSFADEVLHWRRYLTKRSDVVEMWSHVFIIIGHAVMMAGWWRFYLLGYPGVRATLAAIGIQ